MCSWKFPRHYLQLRPLLSNQYSTALIDVLIGFIWMAAMSPENEVRYVKPGHDECDQCSLLVIYRVPQIRTQNSLF